jgi:hypothetical protein
MSLRSAGNYIYFAADAARTVIKIGITSRPALRVDNLTSSSPVTIFLLASAPGTAPQERALHHQFREQWHHGEWFTPNAELLALIEFVRSTSSLPSAQLAPKNWHLPHQKRAGANSEAAREAWRRRKARRA